MNRLLTPADLLLTDDDITDARQKLTGRYDRYAYALGSLESLVELIAYDHLPCSVSDCHTCGHLREALAMTVALDQAREARR